MNTQIFLTETEHKLEESEYLGEDGLIYCSICHEPKEKPFPPDFFLSGLKTHPRPCACERAKRKQEEQNLREENHRREVDRLKSLCFPGRQMWKWTFTSLRIQGKACNAARKYVENWPDMKERNTGLMFWGEVGTGKTYLAACIANALIDQEVSVRMANLGSVLSKGFEERDAYIQDLCSSSLLILDDFGMERNTSFALETVFEVIDTRCAIGKPLIITTNLTPGDLKNPKDLEHKRIYDRILGMTTAVQVTGPDHREIKYRENLQIMKKLILEDIEDEN